MRPYAVKKAFDVTSYIKVTRYEWLFLLLIGNIKYLFVFSFCVQICLMGTPPLVIYKCDYIISPLCHKLISIMYGEEKRLFFNRGI